MTPLELLARLSAIVAPPRYPLLRYHGVLAPRSSWRSDIVPRPPGPRPCVKRRATQDHELPPNRTAASAARPRTADQMPAVATSRGVPSVPMAATAPDPALTLHRPVATQDPVGVERLAPNILSAEHWTRLLGGLLYAASPHVDWATLLRRSFEVDVLRCARCSGRLRVLGEVTESAMVRLVLETIGLPREAPLPARARDPTTLLGAETD